MPLWAWVILALILFSIAMFETAYRHVRSMQPPLLTDIRSLLRRHQTTGFDIRKQRKDGWERRAFEWYKTVLSDLTLIFGDDYSRLFDIEIGRQRNIRFPTGEKNPKYLINHTSDMLEKVMGQELTEDRISPAPELKRRLQEALSK